MIYLLWATIRPKKLTQTWYIWRDFADFPEDLKLKVAVDDGGAKNILEDEGIEDITVVDNPCHGVVAPTHELTKSLKGCAFDDIIILCSDDFTPPRGWDSYLYGKFKVFNGVLKVNDGQMKNIISIPIMTYDAFTKLGRQIYNPAYNHMFADQELHDVAHEMGICKHASCTDPEFRHHHYIHGMREKDEFDNRLTSTWDKAKALYQERRKLPLKERLRW